MNNKQRFFKVVNRNSFLDGDIFPLVQDGEDGVFLGVSGANSGSFFFGHEVEEVFDYSCSAMDKFKEEQVVDQVFSRTDCGMYKFDKREENADSSRVFSSGASRNSDKGKLDFDGFLSPLVLRSYAEYLEANRTMEDGSVRESDNWQKGIPVDQYMKSMWRHFFDVWSTHRGIPTKEDQIANLNAVLFNASGMLHELLKEQNEKATR